MSAENFFKRLLSDEGNPPCKSAYEALVGCVNLIDFVNNADDGNKVELGASWGLLEQFIRDHIEFVEGTDSVTAVDDMTRALLRHLVEMIRIAQKDTHPFVLDNEQEWNILKEEAGRFVTAQDELFVIASDEESGFWSIEEGWGELNAMTSIYSAKERDQADEHSTEAADAKWMSLNEAFSAYKQAPGTFGYYINLDERGDFQADVRNEKGDTVFEISAGDSLGEDETSIFEDGFMRDKDDLAGLTEYLIDLRVIPKGSEILPMSEFEERIAESPAPK